MHRLEQKIDNVQDDGFHDGIVPAPFADHMVQESQMTARRTRNEGEERIPPACFDPPFVIRHTNDGVVVRQQAERRKANSVQIRPTHGSRVVLLDGVEVIVWHHDSLIKLADRANLCPSGKIEPRLFGVICKEATVRTEPVPQAV